MKALFTTTCYTAILILILTTATLAQTTGIVRGIVKTSDGSPASYVTVSLVESKKGTTTTEDGTFTLSSVTPGTYTLRITFVGLQPQTKTVTVSAGQTTTINFILSENASQLDEVEVTGQTKGVTIGKAGLAPLDVPQMTGVVSNIVIENQQISRLGDALRNVSGVSLTQQRQGVSETISARGYSIGVGGGSGSIFKNGILTNTSGYPEASTLESVEVLKGASSLLYGNVSGGLIVNMVTKKPRYDWGGDVSMRVGSFGLYKPIVDLYGPLTKNLAFRVIGTYEKSNSYRDIVKTDRLYVNPSLLYKFSQKTTLLVEGDYLNAKLTPDFGVGAVIVNTVSQIPSDIPRSRFINVAWAYNNMKQGSASATLTHQFNDRWKVNVIAGGQQTDIDSYGAGVPNSVAANGTWNRSLSRGLTSERNSTLQANLTGRFNTGSIGHQLLFGADRVGVTTTSNSFSIISGGKAVTTYDQINILNPLGAERTDIPEATAYARTTSPSVRTGIYVQDLIALSNKVKVLGGVRWSSQKTVQTTIRDLATGAETRGATADKVDQAFSPKVALIYQPLQTTSFFASYANNFVINSGIDVNGQVLAPSIVDQYEAGVKNEFFSGRLTANLGVYRIRNSNLAQMALFAADGTPNANTNVRELTGQTTSDGLEVDITGTLSRNAYFIVGYGYNYMRYTKTSDAKGSYLEGERLTNNPAHTGNATLFYTFDQPGLRGLKVGASAFYTGARFGGYNNTKGQTQTDRRIPLSAFTTLDLTAGYSWKNVTLLAKLSNITNELNYLIHDNYSINPIPPRQYTATLSYKF